jgi:hypothetical protein
MGEYMPYIDEATYRSYAFQRMLHPLIDFMRWRTVYGREVEVMEERFMKEFLRNLGEISY